MNTNVYLDFTEVVSRFESTKDVGEIRVHRVAVSSPYNVEVSWEVFLETIERMMA